MTVRQVLEPLKGDARRTDNINAIMNGFTATNAYLQVRRQEAPLYCAPQNLAITSEQGINILSGYFDRHPEHEADEGSTYAIVLL